MVYRSHGAAARLTEGSVIDVELHQASAAQMAEAIRARDVSSAELVERCLRRIDAVNPLINTVQQATNRRRGR